MVLRYKFFAVFGVGSPAGLMGILMSFWTALSGSIKERSSSELVDAGKAN
jgi:hypothetical protein